MKEIPKMYQNKVAKEFHNNREVYTSFKSNTKSDSNIIRKKINEIVGSKSFIYSKLVHIVIGNEVINRKIIGLYNDQLVTIDNEYIPISNIKDIYI